ncbi:MULTISPECIES: hypothetical protein [Sphingomonas]|uniref:hypothetical protein n=1 Tax=Sphingomonas TaxID=13687 RepID=UPI000DEFA5DA|nr:MULTISPECIES: hypothetical protein [Sphingomonas]
MLRLRAQILLATVCCWTQAAAAQSREDRIEPSAKQMAKLQELTPAGVAAVVQVKDDDLEPTAVLDTSKAYFSNGAFTDRVRSDAFLRALVNKSTGAVTYQVYENVRYNYVARHFTSANIATAAGPMTVPVQPISFKVDACFATLCSYEEDVGFVVPEPILREIAASYKPSESTPWRFRLKSSGLDWEDRLMPAEVAGLLQAVEAYQSRHLKR